MLFIYEIKSELIFFFGENTLTSPKFMYMLLTSPLFSHLTKTSPAVSSSLGSVKNLISHLSSLFFFPRNSQSPKFIPGFSVSSKEITPTSTIDESNNELGIFHSHLFVRYSWFYLSIVFFNRPFLLYDDVSHPLNFFFVQLCSKLFG